MESVKALKDIKDRIFFLGGYKGLLRSLCKNGDFEKDLFAHSAIFIDGEKLMPFGVVKIDWEDMKVE